MGCSDYLLLSTPRASSTARTLMCVVDNQMQPRRLFLSNSCYLLWVPVLQRLVVTVLCDGISLFSLPFFGHTLLLKKAYQHKGKTCEIAVPFSVSEHVQCVVLYLQLASELVASSNAVEWLVSLYLLFFCVLRFRFISLYLLSVSHRRFIFSRVTLFFFCR